MTDARVLDDAPWLTSGPAARVLALLNGDGEEARVVGGAVRNALLGIPIGDIDIATTALPAEVIRRAKAAGIKSVPTGIEHGTVTLVVEAQPFEVTTLREDAETFGRKAKVAFGRDWVRDAERRDFTINGLSVDADGVVHDHVGGLADIAARRVRFIGDPDQRIAEDYLRILQVFPHPRRLRRRRARSRRATSPASRAAPAWRRCRPSAMRDGNAEADGRARRGRAPSSRWRRRAAAADFRRRRLYRAVRGDDRGRARARAWSPIAVRRLGALAVAVTEDAERLAARLRLTNAETRALDSMGHRWWRLAGMDEARARRRLYRLGADRYRDRLMLAWARSGDAPRRPRCGASSRPCRSAGARRNFRSRRPISSRRGIAEGPGARACPRAGRRRLARGGFSARSGRARSHRRPDRRTFQPRHRL